MQRRVQFGMRENPASDRRHGSRLDSVSNASLIQLDDGPLPPPRLSQHCPAVDAESKPNVARNHAATGADRKSADEHHASASVLVHPQRTTSGFEPLIASPEAARLLGNIHVKTLQRYARRGNLPGYQIGGHWYFRASELDSWLRSRLNSSCHPCRLQEKSDGT
jgi:excisionase family DNA binding protein